MARSRDRRPRPRSAASPSPPPTKPRLSEHKVTWLLVIGTGLFTLVFMALVDIIYRQRPPSPSLLLLYAVGASMGVWAARVWRPKDR